MFLNKLTGTEIGLTAWDMFVINKPTVMTVSSTHAGNHNAEVVVPGVWHDPHLFLSSDAIQEPCGPRQRVRLCV
jgi:hypothetical protein